MKRKEAVYLIIAAAMFAVTGIVLTRQLGKGKATGVAVEVVSPIEAKFDPSALSALTDPKVIRYFYQPVDLTSGVGNGAPFGAF